MLAMLNTFFLKMTDGYLWIAYTKNNWWSILIINLVEAKRSGQIWKYSSIF
ncbi:hypothetical protein N692_04090 [Lactiplantibacillus plantarum EGD-AQ4]|nr:hypothetical protein N692_04090 [Lactiplantibacillus plantarum EGD-AQ4]